MIGHSSSQQGLAQDQAVQQQWPAITALAAKSPWWTRPSGKMVALTQAAKQLGIQVPEDYHVTPTGGLEQNTSAWQAAIQGFSLGTLGVAGAFGAAGALGGAGGTLGATTTAPLAGTLPDVAPSGALAGAGGAGAAGTGAGLAAVPEIPGLAGSGFGGSALAGSGLDSTVAGPTLASTATTPTMGGLAPNVTPAGVPSIPGGVPKIPGGLDRIGRIASGAENQRIDDRIIQGEQNHQFNQDQLAANKFNLDAPGIRASNSIRGDILANVKNTDVSGPIVHTHGQIPQITGGLQPGLLSDSSRQLGQGMSRQALIDSLKQPYQPLAAPQSNGLDTGLNIAGLAGLGEPWLQKIPKIGGYL